MAEFSEIIGKLVLLMVIVFSGMLFIVTLQDADDSPQRMEDNSIFNDSLTGLTGQINNATNEADEKYNVFNSENPKEGFGSILLFGIVSVGKSFSSIIFGFFLNIIKLPLVVFGIPLAIYNLFIVLLIIVVIVSVWRLYKLGG